MSSPYISIILILSPIFKSAFLFWNGGSIFNCRALNRTRINIVTRLCRFNIHKGSRQFSFPFVDCFSKDFSSAILSFFFSWLNFASGCFSFPFTWLYYFHFLSIHENISDKHWYTEVGILIFTEQGTKVIFWPICFYGN